jgi:phosphate:Na+ symporter
MAAREITLIIFGLVGGLAIFLYGIRLASEGLRKAAGGQLRALLSLLTKNRFLALFTGASLTLATQSSSATTVMLVSFANAALIELEQAIGVILGADIGTTFTVQLIAFRISEYAPLMVALGFLINLISRQRKLKYSGQVILGFGLLFLGMGIMAEACHPLRSSEAFVQTLLNFGENPILMLLIAAAFTALIQSSAATLGLALVLSLEGLLTLKGALPLILGANIGTCATALLASLGTSREGKRVALAHLVFKVGGVLIFFPFLTPFSNFIARTAGDLSRQIANAHTFFNLTMAFLFLPFTFFLAALLKRLVPREKGEFAREVKHLEEGLLNTPALALNAAGKEVFRMADLTQQMLEGFQGALLKDEERMLLDLEKKEQLLDSLSREIARYLRRLSQKVLSEEESQRGMNLLYITNNLENIGDILDRNLGPLAEKKIEKNLSFSVEGSLDLARFHEKVLANLKMAIESFDKNDLNLARELIKRAPGIGNLQREFQKRHIARLEKELPESLETSTIYLDVISNLKRINSHITSIAYAILGET